MKNKIIATLLSSTLFIPLFVFAATPKFIFEGVCSGVDCDFAAFSRLINNIINWFLGISVTVAAITFAYAGAQILLNPESPMLMGLPQITLISF